ncbi:pirin family protein [Methylopila musalis]|uniref:Pirin family protein n=1 Tax=Methylopila musalis TaxID=1134781 RepID=A0ABW3ZB17_9HYPH
MRQVLGIYRAPRPHWVGDGFPVRTMLSHHDHGRHISPFIMLDHAGPHAFAPTTDRRGVGAHPHKGFETVTIVYDGEVEHRDSTGAGGVIGPGDVQWMTAASGIVHEEFHSPGYAAKGGPFEMAQLWVNLPAKDKGAAAGYQTLVASDIPAVELANGAGRVRVVAGAFGKAKGPARTFTPMDILDVRLTAGGTVPLDIADGRTLAVIALSGSVRIDERDALRAGETAVFAREGGAVRLTAETDAKLLVLSGEPIDEPVVAHGPFVMNSADEIRQAIADFQAGRFGHIAPAA